MKTLVTKQTVKAVSILTLSFVIFGTALFAQPIFKSEENFVEDEIKIEEWMTSNESFDANFNNETYDEPQLQIENWMLNSNELLPALDENFIEEDMAIQDWMLDFNTFSNEKHEEPMLTIQNWMLNYNTFAKNEINIKELVAEYNEEPLKIETWMTSIEAFDIPTLSFISSIQATDFSETKPLLIALHDVK